MGNAQLFMNPTTYQTLLTSARASYQKPEPSARRCRALVLAAALVFSISAAEGLPGTALEIPAEKQNLYSQGQWFYLSNDNQQAEACFKRLLPKAGATESSFDDSRLHALALFWLGLVASADQQSAAALTFYRQALARQSQLGSRCAADRIHTLANLATEAEQSGDKAGARQAFLSRLQEEEKLFAANHPRLWRTRFGILDFALRTNDGPLCLQVLKRSPAPPTPGDKHKHASDDTLTNMALDLARNGLVIGNEYHAAHELTKAACTAAIVMAVLEKFTMTDSEEWISASQLFNDMQAGRHVEQVEKQLRKPAADIQDLIVNAFLKHFDKNEKARPAPDVLLKQELERMTQQAQILRLDGKVDQAEALCTNALSRAQALPPSSERDLVMVRLLWKKAENAQCKRRYADELAYCRQALELARHSQDQVYETEALRVQSGAFMETGDFAAAERTARQAVKIACHDTHRCKTRVTLAQVLTGQGRRQQALPYLQEAMAIAKTKGYYREQASIQSMLDRYK